MQIKLLDTISREQQQGNSTKTLWDLVDQYRRKLLLKPDHQRDFIWSEETKKKFINTIQTVRMLSVSFITYQIKYGEDDWSPVFLNDGGNRINTASTFYDTCEEFGISKQEAEMIMRGISVCVVHWHHKNYLEAVDEFQRANKGTGLTPLEYYAYHLSYLEDYNKEIVKRIHDCMESCDDSLRVIKPRSRHDIHKVKRANLSHFLRFCEPMKQYDYDVTGKDKSVQVVEGYIAEYLQSHSRDENQKQISKFENVVYEETRLFEQEWEKYLIEMKPDPKKGKRPLSTTLYRYCLDIGILRRSKKLDIEMHREFLRKIIRLADGQGAIYTDGDRATLSLARMSRTRFICGLMGLDEYGLLIQPVKKEIKRKVGPPQRKGIHNSHVEPFSTNGNGATFPELALINRTRGAKPVTPEEIKANLFV